ncbi:hypothetical protein JQ760_028435 (plasmid) [Klebsiella pneumoniae]|uniref:hypothetical protein n=1 Tax=Klebsiella pneumoniae TaxID=573 RepID=UPI001FACE8E5|nr:hypothetical protein [Klebsiella pneumoniae]MCI8108408.1 hypothetical protein [Klebsiella pneumoniae]
MFTISKKTFDMAKKRGFELTLEEGLTSDGSLLLCFWEEGQDSEWLFSYQHTGHQLVWHGNVYAPKRIVTLLPKVIDDEYELRDMISVLGKLTSQKYRASINACLSKVSVNNNVWNSYKRPNWIESERQQLMGNVSRFGSGNLF